jgi:aspartate kinase
MLVYKFGGGILTGAGGIKRMSEIIRSAQNDNKGEKIVIVVSALGKMTNAFEELYREWKGDITENYAFDNIKDFHYEIGASILGRGKTEDILSPLFARIAGLVSGSFPKDPKRAYDQLVRYGELLSAEIISAFLHKSDLDHKLINAGDLIVTDNNYTDAKVDWGETELRLKSRLGSKKGGGLFLTQGFIARSIQGQPTTLGREGSDFSAAIIASVLNAREIIIWKDVPGIMSSDPAIFPDSVKLDQVSYIEAIELSYYGAKILHPNTIKPLHNKDIPLSVRSMFYPGEKGTLVTSDPVIDEEKPVIIVKPNQVLVSILPRDLSFIMEERLADLFAYLSRNRIKSNLFQHSAVSISICMDYNENLVNRLVGDLINEYRILYNPGLDLLTIRHYTPEVVEKYTSNRQIYVRQQSRKTARFVLS